MSTNYKGKAAVIVARQDTTELSPGIENKFWICTHILQYKITCAIESACVLILQPRFPSINPNNKTFLMAYRY